MLLIKPPLTYTLSDYGKCKKSRFGANCTFLRNKVRFESKTCAIYKHCKTEYFTEVILSALKFPFSSDVKASNIQGIQIQPSKRNYPYNLNNYFDFNVCLSIRPSVRSCVRKLTPISAVVSQNVTDKSFLVWGKTEIYAFWVILRHGVHEER